MYKLALLVLLPLAATASGRELPAQDPELLANEANVEPTILPLGNLQARLTVPVAVGNRGPYNFIIDTGAERTVVSRELARDLQLSAGQPVSLTSMTGRSTVGTVIVPGLAIESIGERHTVIAPALDGRNLGAAGLLGIDTLRNHQISIDFEKGVMAVRPSKKRVRETRSNLDEIVIRAKNQFGQLILTDAYFGNMRVQVVLDTGSEVTVGNSVLRRRLGGRIGRTQMIELTSVTGGKARVEYSQVPYARIGPITFDKLAIAFADLAPFARFGLTKRPALLLGMDSLRSFRRVDIDFPNRQVRFLMPKGVQSNKIPL
jgi:predicted aspartyl protease